ncbi:transcriptional regulator [Brevibacillus formosus]|uniref:Transcriptional regulator n=1 Tax=Brevibacillus formosus TaxID=54913 RepID=A0A220MFV7_9BACL|nr:BlaI/MecI/CopY family transcriptional regulator [Brevibacillus formosus]ASJ53924.1 transcriptional regulator [Brevibacillus formosus]
MMSIPKISEAEWEIMKVIWRHHPATAEQIIERLPADIEWTEQTVRTFLNRLLKKKAITYEKAGRSYRYFPLVQEDECKRAESESFLKRVFNGAVGTMMTNFLEDVQLSNEEIDKLQKILTEKQKKKQ